MVQLSGSVRCQEQLDCRRSRRVSQSPRSADYKLVPASSQLVGEHGVSVLPTPQQALKPSRVASGIETFEFCPLGVNITILSPVVRLGVALLAVDRLKTEVPKPANGRMPVEPVGASSIHSADSFEAL